jgi:hypothetical protein
MLTASRQDRAVRRSLASFSHSWKAILIGLFEINGVVRP